MRLPDILLTYLKSNKSNYRELRKYLHGYSRNTLHTEPAKQTLSTTLQRLKKRGLLIYEKGAWQTTYLGRKYIDNKKPLKFFQQTKMKNSYRKIICMFDIPEDIRHKRDWLRTQLELLGFTLLQNSVWVGPAPLPQEFITYLKEINLISHIKFLEVTNKDII